MPQLDFLILSSQINFLFIFFFGYFLFLKELLPFVSYFLKIKYKLIISNLNWFNNNFNKLLFNRKSLLISLLKLSSFLNIIYFFKKENFFFFNLYLQDFLVLRNLKNHKK
jgi:hypothetical protein